MEKHNHKAIAIAVFLHQILGFIWYSPNVFGSMWALGAGRSGSYLDGNNPLPFIASIFGAILLSYLMSWLFLVLVIDDWQRGLFVGLIIGCGFIAPMIVMHYMFLGLPYNVIMIDSVKDIVGAGFTGLLLATWRADRSDELVG